MIVNIHRVRELCKTPSGGVFPLTYSRENKNVYHVSHRKCTYQYVLTFFGLGKGDTVLCYRMLYGFFVVGIYVYIKFTLERYVYMQLVNVMPPVPG